MVLFFANKFTLKREKKSDLNKKLLAGQEALFVLSMQLNIINLYKINFLDVYRDKENRHFLIPHITDIDRSQFRINIQSLSYLMTDYPELLSKIYGIQEHYFITLEAAKNRSNEVKKLHDEYLSNKEFFNNNITVETYALQFSATKYQFLKQITDALYERVDECVEHYLPRINELRSALLRTFPGEKFITTTLNQ